MSELKFASQLTDEELTEIYKSFMCEKDKFVDLTITRCEFGIALEGHIRIPEEDPDYADEDGMCLIDEDYGIKLDVQHRKGELVLIQVHNILELELPAGIK